MTKSGKRNHNTQKKNEGVKQVNIINIKLFDIVIEFCTPPRPSENGTSRHITVGRAAIATPP